MTLTDTSATINTINALYQIIYIEYCNNIELKQRKNNFIISLFHMLKMLS